jgi:hypothetical protein
MHVLNIEVFVAWGRDDFGVLEGGARPDGW